MSEVSKPHSVREMVLDYLKTEDYPDGWITPDEITDAAAPDLLLARELWRTLEQYEVLKSSEAQAWNKAQFETDRANGLQEQLEAAEARIRTLEARNDDPHWMRRAMDAEEQLEALREWSERALTDFNAQLDKAPPNVLPHMGELADLVNSYPAKRLM